MSKFLKVIVNLVVLFSIVVAAALLVPPFAGIDTVMNDNTNTETNIPVGSVAYGKEIKVKELKKKDRIIYSEGSSTYVYEITDMDASAGAYEVKDPYSKSSEAEVVTLQKSVPKVAVVVPFIGYAAIALQSKEGLIVIGLGIVLLIILFILSELWRKDDDDEDDEEEDNEDDEDDDEEEMSRKERRRLKKEENRRRKEEKRRLKEAEEDEEYEEDDDEDEEEELSRKERRRLKKEEKRRRKLAKKGLLEDEDEEEESSETEIAEPVSLDEGEQQQEELQGFDEAMKEAMSSIALGVSQVNASENSEQEVVPETEPAKEADIEGTEPEMPEEIPATDVPEAAEDIQSGNLFEMQEEISDEPKVDVNAVPKMPSLEELLAKAEAAGEKPEVKKDKENEVTLLDYSDIL